MDTSSVTFPHLGAVPLRPTIRQRSLRARTTVTLTGSESSSSVALSLRLQPLLSNGRKSGNVGQTLKQTVRPVTDIQIEYSNRKA